MPSPDKYNIKGQFGKDHDKYDVPNVTYGPNKIYSFGVSRNEIKPIYIDHINRMEKKLVATPGPGTYRPLQTFGHEGRHASMHRKIAFNINNNKKEGVLPGPTSYDLPVLMSQNIP